MKTLREFCEKSHVPASLIRAVVKQSGGWGEWDQTARDVTRGGADGGFHGFIYYTDTVPFANRNKAAILEMAKAQADDLGEPLYKMIATFRCLSPTNEGAVAEAIHNPRSEDRTLVLNALAWYALEEVARSYCDLTEAD